MTENNYTKSLLDATLQNNCKLIRVDYLYGLSLFLNVQFCTRNVGLAGEGSAET